MRRITLHRRIGSVDVAVEGDSTEVRSMLKDLDSITREVEELSKTNYSEHFVTETPLVSKVATPTEGIIALFKTSWALHPRNSKEIEDALKNNGIYCPATTLSGVLASLVNQDKLRRWKVEDRYVYQRGRFG